VRKSRSNVAEDQRFVILVGLVSNDPRIRPVHRIELILSNIGNPSGEAEEKALNGNDIDCIDHAVAIHISSRQWASWWERYDIEEMPLGGDHINSVNAW